MSVGNKPTVYVIDPDVFIVTTLQGLFSSVHIEAEYFDSAGACLARVNRYSRGCIVADAEAPDLCIATFLRRLHENGIELPVIFLAYSSDVATAVNALKRGAVDFLEKPFNGQTLLDTVHRTIESDQIAAHDRAVRQELWGRFEALTAREREVLVPMVKGCSNRMIAGELGLSEKTIEAYRSRIMHKIGTTNLPELIRMAMRIDLLGERTHRLVDPRRTDRPSDNIPGQSTDK
ncbi:MAG: response regulator transcription factor [Nitrococcus mobilis]|nr:response regulator transcription factor [Nitrococcus mobilis]